jgi:hypothetical protein
MRDVRGPDNSQNIMMPQPVQKMSPIKVQAAKKEKQPAKPRAPRQAKTKDAEERKQGPHDETQLEDHAIGGQGQNQQPEKKKRGRPRRQDQALRSDSSPGTP